MADRMTGWPPTAPFPESLRDTVGDNSPDFPGSSGGREQGKFRPSATPKLTTVAVVGDDGLPLARTTEQLLEEVLLYQKALLVALSMLANGASFSADDVLASVS